MKHYHNISVQHISWVKSNKSLLEPIKGIKNLYYPENLSELEQLITSFIKESRPFLIIGFSSNTLFLPTFSIENVVCTKYLNHWEEKDGFIICDCGVSVSSLAKKMVEKGYIGFEGLTDLPGTIGAGIYGNCGCRGCSVNSIVEYFTLLCPSGDIVSLTPKELALQYRSTKLKRKEMKGVILRAYIRIKKGDKKELIEIAEKNHQIRKKNQPSPANNLGTTFLCKKPTIKGLLYKVVERGLRLFTHNDVVSYSLFLQFIGKNTFVPYTHRLNRYMFLDAKAHVIFPLYVEFVKNLYKETQLEIEIRD